MENPDARIFVLTRTSTINHANHLWGMRRYCAVEKAYNWCLQKGRIRNLDIWMRRLQLSNAAIDKGIRLQRCVEPWRVSSIAHLTMFWGDLFRCVWERLSCDQDHSVITQFLANSADCCVWQRGFVAANKTLGVLKALSAVLHQLN